MSQYIQFDELTDDEQSQLESTIHQTEAQIKSRSFTIWPSMDDWIDDQLEESGLNNLESPLLDALFGVASSDKIGNWLIFHEQNFVALSTGKVVFFDED